jgi:hypothetical protein
LGVKSTVDHFRDMVDVHRKEVAQVLSGVMQSLGGDAVRSIRNYRGSDPAAAVEHAINIGEWEDKLKAAIEDTLMAAAKAGAAGEWLINHSKTVARMESKSGLPSKLLKAVSGLVSRLLDGKTWTRLVTGIAKATKDAVRRAMGKGASAADAAASVLTEPLSVGVRIARAADVEASAAVNGGRHASFTSLLMAGKVVGRRWMTCRDAHVRDSHKRAHGQVARGDAPFTVGGEECQYPGDPSLSPAQRCRCRCVSISIGG